MALKRTAISHPAPVPPARSPPTPSSTSALATSPNRLYYTARDFQRPTVLSRYAILGFLSSGTYGRVYKARIRRPNSQSANGSPAGLMGTPGAANVAKRIKLTKEDGEEREGELVAIKKFKPDKDGEVVAYTGISQSACREIMINREISHEHITALREVMLEEKSIYLVFEFAEHDFLQIIHHHSSTRSTLPFPVLKSLLWQLLNGIAYLHDNWIIHRDLKPANILVTASGQVKIGDLGLARLYQEPLQSLYTSDKIVVTVWYRAPELLLGARHYTPAIDQWSLGCIFGELLALRPMFKGEEAKIDVGGGGKKGGVPFQKDQMTRVVELLGNVDKNQWPGVVQLPEYSQLSRFDRHTNELYPWFSSKLPRGTNPSLGFDFLRSLLIYDPSQRLSARSALGHPWWTESPQPHANAFLALPQGASYPLRRVTHDDISSSAANKQSSFGTGVGSGPAGGVGGGSGTLAFGTGVGGSAKKRSRGLE